MTKEEILERVNQLLLQCKRYEQLVHEEELQRMERRKLSSIVEKELADLKWAFKASLSVPCPFCDYPVLITFLTNSVSVPYSWQAKCEHCGFITPAKKTLEEVFTLLESLPTAVNTTEEPENE